MAKLDPWEVEQEDMTWAQALVQGGQNLPSSTIKAGGEIVDAVMNPIETGHTLLKLMQGSFHLILPEEIQQRFDPEGKTEESQAMAQAVGQYFVDKYSSEDSIKHAVATDPASILMDIATVLSGGGAALTKTGQLTNLSKVSSVGNALQKTAKYTDPIVAPIALTGTAINKTGILAREVGGATSGTGGAAVANVVDESRAGAIEGTIGTKGDRLGQGEQGQAVTQAMRGGGDLTEVLNIAKRDVEVMKAKKADNYRADKELWGKDKTILDFKAIDEAIQRAEKIVTYQGNTVINQKGLAAVKEIQDIIVEFKGKDPRTHHTVEGFDKMKQKIWSVVEGVDPGNATASGIAKNMYHSVKKTIADQAPGYSRAMKEYGDAMELINEIEKTLSLGKKANIDTAIRKLNSIMRNNVSTNYTQRMKLAKQLEDVGGEKFIAQLAGQQFNSLMPRNIQGALLPTLATGAVYTGGGSIPGAAAMLATGSPRIVGETANMTGYIMGKLEKLPTPSYEGIGGLLEILYQSQATMENKQNQ